MKLNIYIFLLVILCISSCSGQVSDISRDSLVINVHNSLPEGWTLMIQDKELIIEKTDSIWILEGNWINAPREDYEDSEKNKKRIIEYGQRQTARIVFEMVDLWTPEKIDSTKRTDNPNLPDYNTELFSLYEKEFIGFDNEYQRIFPWYVSEEAFMIYHKIVKKTFNEIDKK